MPLNKKEDEGFWDYHDEYDSGLADIGLLGPDDSHFWGSPLKVERESARKRYIPTESQDKVYARKLGCVITAVGIIVYIIGVILWLRAFSYSFAILLVVNILWGIFVLSFFIRHYVAKSEKMFHTHPASYKGSYAKNTTAQRQNNVRTCPKCGSKRVELVENDYWSPEADECRYYEYKCMNCGNEWEEEWS